MALRARRKSPRHKNTFHNRGEKKMRNAKIIPIFYICNDESVGSTVTSLRSIIDKRDESYNYSVCILHDGLNKKNMKKMFDLGKCGVNITLEDMSAYTKCDTVSFSPDFVRAFIPEMFPGYHRSILVNNDYRASEDIGRYLDGTSANSPLLRIGY